MSSNKNWKNLILIIIRNLFLAFFALLVIFTFLEIIKPKIIINYLNLDLFVLSVIILGLTTVIYCEIEKKESKKLNFLDYSAIILFSILVGILCLYLTRVIGWLCVLIGLASAIISYFFIIENCKDN